MLLYPPAEGLHLRSGCIRTCCGASGMLQGRRATRCTIGFPAVKIRRGLVRAQCSTLPDLGSWLVSYGGQVHGVELVCSQIDHETDRTLQATRVIQPGDTLVSVPECCQVRYTGNQTLQMLQLLQQVPNASGTDRGAWQFKMALQLLQHRCAGTASPLAPYIAHLPGVAPGVPTPPVAMLSNAAVREALQDPQLVADAEGQWYWCEKFAADVLQGLPGSPGDAFHGVSITPALLGWALSIAMSRSFGVRHIGGHVMAPLIDMANHAWEPNTEVRSSEDGSVTMFATKRIEPGEPILLRYGRHSNRDLLLSYGFLLGDNPFDRYSSPLDAESTLAAVLQFLGMQLPATGRAVDGLVNWQRTALQQLHLIPPAGTAVDADGSSKAVGGSSATSSSSSGLTEVAAPVLAETDAGSSGDSASSSHRDKEQGSSGSNMQDADPAVRQQQQQSRALILLGGEPPVNPELLALLRVVLCQDRKLIKGRPLEELGDWRHPLTAGGDALVMKALVGLLTVLYKSSGTSIQEDKQLLQQLGTQQESTGASQTRTSGAAAGAPGGASSSNSNAVGQPAGDAEAASASTSTVEAAWPSELVQQRLAVQYRLARKQLLEGVMRSCLLRMQEGTANKKPG